MRKLIAGSRAQLGCPLCADFVAEVGGDTRVAVVTNFLK
jgi:Cdc6-like AAA superfamily ATPase